MAFSALPSSSTCYVLAARMGYDGTYVAGLVTLSTLLGLVSLPVRAGSPALAFADESFPNHAVMSALQSPPNSTRIYRTQIAPFLPRRIVDIHTHVWQRGTDAPRPGRLVAWPALGRQGEPARDLLETYRRLLPGQDVVPLMFGHLNNRAADFPGGNGYIATWSAGTVFPGLMYAGPTGARGTAGAAAAGRSRREGLPEPRGSLAAGERDHDLRLPAAAPARGPGRTRPDRDAHIPRTAGCAIP